MPGRHRSPSATGPRHAAGVRARRHRLSLRIGGAVLAVGVVSLVLVGEAFGNADPPGEVTVVTSADAFVDANQPDANRGDAPWVTVANDPVHYGYFRFDVTLPADTTVTGAQFRCLPGNDDASGAVLWPGSNAWDEQTITWSNAPLPDSNAAPIATTGPVTRDQWASADVSAAVTGSGTYTFVMGSDSHMGWSCASRENNRNSPPELRLTTAAASTSSSPAPSTSPAASTTSSPAPSTSASSPAPSTSSPGSTTSSPAPSTSASSPAPSTSPPPSTGHKVLVIPLENHSQSEALSQMPTLAAWATTFGQATSYFAVGHPSLPNYFAIWGGSTFGVTSDCSVGESGCVPSPPSVWGQTLSAGGTAKAYQESMTSACQTSGSGEYAPRHGPWPYWTDGTERTACQAHDVASGTITSGNLLQDVTAGNLPITGELTPNLCNDGHDCALSVADSWLAGWLPVIMAGPDYTAGRLTIIITFDEDDSSQNNKVAFVVVDPRLHAVTVTGTYNHYSLTRWLDDNAGVSRLRNAASAPDLRAAFGL